MLKAMVELWWARKRLPMRSAPDSVLLQTLSADNATVTFARSGCVLARLTIPRDALKKYLNRRVGPQA